MDTHSSQCAVAWVVGGEENAVCTSWRQTDFESSLVTAPCHDPQLLWLILGHTCRLKGISEILLLENCWFQAATHAFQTHSRSKHHDTPDSAPSSSERELYFDHPSLLKNILLGLSLLQKKTSKEMHLGTTCTSKHPAASLPFSGAWFMCVFSRLSPLLTTACSVVPRCFHLYSGSHRGGDTLFSVHDELGSSPSISASSVNHWTSFTPVIKLSKDGGLCTPQEDWSRTCNQTVLFTAHRERKYKGTETIKPW